MNDNLPTFLTDKQLAAELGIAKITLQVWRGNGEGPPYIRVGRSIRYAKADVTAWLAAQTCGKVA